MTMKNAFGAAIAAALLVTAMPAFAHDVRDPGRLPRPDKLRDTPPPPVASEPASKTTAAEEVDLRDPGHAVPPDRLRDGVRRR